MTQPDLSDTFHPAAVEDYRQQAHVFLEKARQYLLEDDLHQASEKGWGAAAWIAKAVAVNQGWEYESHPQFPVVMYNASVEIRNDRVRLLGRSASGLHRNYYTRRLFLLAEDVRKSLEDMDELLAALEPLTLPDAS